MVFLAGVDASNFVNFFTDKRRYGESVGEVEGDDLSCDSDRLSEGSVEIREIRLP